MTTEDYTRKLYDVAREYPPDFDKMEELLKAGADINGMADEYDSILSAVISGYAMGSEVARDEDDVGKAMLKLIRFFLDHGFDVHRNNDMYGSDCVSSLVTATYDVYSLKALRLFLEAGVRVDIESEGSTAKGDLGTEAAYMSIEEDAYLETMFEIMYEMADRYSRGERWQGLDMYDKCIGKTVQRVLVPEKQSVPFSQYEAPDGKGGSLIEDRLLFELDHGVLSVDQYGIAMKDDHLPDVPLKDVSLMFRDMIGKRINDCKLSWESSEDCYHITVAIETDIVTSIECYVIKRLEGNTRTRTSHTFFIVG